MRGRCVGEAAGTLWLSVRFLVGRGPRQLVFHRRIGLFHYPVARHRASGSGRAGLC